jgi:hypothetical protein
MNPNPSNTPMPEGLPARALATARKLLAGRLRRGGVSTSRPDWYFQCEAAEPQAYAGGWQVRVRTWRHWSDASVHVDGQTGEMLYRCVDRLSDPPSQTEMSQSEAERAAARQIAIPPDARLAAFTHETFAEGRRVARLEWQHVHDGLRVDGDHLWVLLHPQTGQLIAYSRKWRPVTLGAESQK